MVVEIPTAEYKVRIRFQVLSNGPAMNINETQIMIKFDGHSLSLSDFWRLAQGQESCAD